MRFEKFIPQDALKPYIRHFIISENTDAHTYKVFPGTDLVIGFQYRGQLARLNNGVKTNLTAAGITGLVDRPAVFQHTPDIGTILIFFTAHGLAAFSSCPANELFNQSISLEEVFDRQQVTDTKEKLAAAADDRQRIRVVEQFLLRHLKESQRDKLVIEAVKLIYASGGHLKISDLQKKLLISPSALEKRFRRLVGTTPKKFSSIIRFNNVLKELDQARSLTDLCYEHQFFDQAHFIRNFKQYAGDTPENFRRFL
ncbi:MAG: helix-turn-helix transcriptional regulator [Sphingobacteriales bacterium]|nr:helix-turn-helix transcriptional regulator [Sphingobacteriales bacterium]OJW32418.1 MAG: AraC family transcriptional regulator [Sphingobacteriales bacterium 46-32]